MRIHIGSLTAGWLLSLFLPHHAANAEVQLDKLEVPEGFSISVLTNEVPNARQMALSRDQRTLFVGTRRAGDVYALKLDEQGAVVSRHLLLTGLTMPSGIALRDREATQDLYVGALNEIVIVRDAANAAGDQPVKAELLTDQLPDERHHGWKYLTFAADGSLFVPVGAPCNICRSKDPRFASILKMDPDTGEHEVYAAGVRNSVGMAIHPQTETLWFTDNGRDHLGDSQPREELNHAPTSGQHYGYPFVHAGTVQDPKFGKDANPNDYAPPKFTITAHSAALGIDFNTHNDWGKPWHNALFVAEHGSWNRSTKVGYKVSAVVFKKDGTKLYYRQFVTGWLQGEENWGRPNDVLFTDRGTLLISDDQAGAIYEVRRDPNTPPYGVESAASR